MLSDKLGLKSDFNKNVAMLFAGTTVAQAIPVAISPILTRLYTPDEFGLFALFFSVSNLLGVIATARYELAIVLPKDDEGAVHLEQLCYIISACMGVFLLLGVWIFHDSIVIWLGNPDLDIWLYFVPVSVFFTGVIQTYSYKLNRSKSFQRISFLKISQTTASSGTSLALGILKLLKNGLIIGHLIGQIITIAIRARKILRHGLTWKEVKKTAINYKHFAFYNAPAALLNTAAASLPILYLSKILERRDVGFYGLVERSIAAPISLVSYSISQVLLEDVASRHKLNLPLRPRLLKLIFSLAMIGIIPFTLLFLFSEDIFSFVFGPAWAEAGKYASILSVAFFMRFVVSPLSMVLISTNSLKVLVFWQTLYFCSTLVVVLFSVNAKDATTFLLAFAANDVILYSIYLLLILYIVKK